MSIIYKSKSGKTVSAGRYQVTADTGVELEVADAELDQLVTDGVLEKYGEPVVAEVVVAPKGTPTPTVSK